MTMLDNNAMRGQLTHRDTLLHSVYCTRADAMVNDIVPLYRHPNNINGSSKTVYNTLKSLTSDGDA